MAFSVGNKNIFIISKLVSMQFSKTTKILLLGANIWYFAEGMLGPLFAVFAQKIGGDILDITWAWATYLIITGILYIVFGRLINGRENKERIMVLGYLLNAFFTFGYLFVSNPMQLFIVQAGLGVAEAMGTPAWDSLYAKSLDDTMDSYAWGLSTGQAQIFTGVAFGFGGLITHFISFDVLFITMGVIQIIAAIVTAQLLFRKKS